MSALSSGDGDAAAVIVNVGVSVGVGVKMGDCGVTDASVLVTTKIIGVALGYSIAVADSGWVMETVAVGVGSVEPGINGEFNNAAMIVAKAPIIATAIIGFDRFAFLGFGFRRVCCDAFLFPTLITFPSPAIKMLSETFPSMFASMLLSEFFSGVRFFMGIRLLTRADC